MVGIMDLDVQFHGGFLHGRTGWEWRDSVRHSHHASQMLAQNSGGVAFLSTAI